MTAATSSRWHDPLCTKPIVVLGSDNNPQCTACQAAPDIEKVCAILKQHTTPGREGGLHTEEGEGASDLNLRWPTSIRFVKPESSSQSIASPQPSDTQPSIDKSEEATNSLPGCNNSDQLLSTNQSPIYEPTLAPNQFRLAYLTPTVNPSHSIHLDLETYEDDNYPEYETASYTWAGEDEDATPCRPVFFGPYWDVSLHTKNCWELLRFARPTRGIRLIWIDAVCINQSDITERNIQVQKMGSIYKNCTRVVIYLGPDIAEYQAETHRFPTRHRLHELPSGADPPKSSPSQPLNSKSMKEVLSLRYFTRIWIIQELVLAPQAQIRIGYADYVVDSRTVAVFQGLNEKIKTMPWLQMISKQSLGVANTLEALSIVRHSRATDARDRLFGILGVITRNQLKAQLQIDYSLSNKQLWIGYFAHALLVEKALWFLEYARGHGESVGRPSWVPRWESLTAWSDFVKPARSSENFVSTCRTMAGGPGGRVLLIQLRSIIMDSSSIWHNRAAVCASTGALKALRVQHAFTFRTAPTLYTQSKNANVFRLKHAGIEVFLQSRTRLDKVIEPDRDHLFVLHADNQRAIFLVLRVESDLLDIRNAQAFSTKQPMKTELPQLSSNLVGLCQFVIIKYSNFDLWENLPRDADPRPGPRRFTPLPQDPRLEILDDISCFGPQISVVEWLEGIVYVLDRSLNEPERYWLLADENCSLLSSETNKYLSNRGLRGPRYWHILPIIWSLATCKNQLSAMISNCFSLKFLENPSDENKKDHNGTPPTVRLGVPPGFWDSSSSMLLRHKESPASTLHYKRVWRYRSNSSQSQKWRDLEDVFPNSETWNTLHEDSAVPMAFEMTENFIHGLRSGIIHTKRTDQLKTYCERLHWVLGVRTYTEMENLLRNNEGISEVVPRIHQHRGIFEMNGQEYLVDIS